MEVLNCLRPIIDGDGFTPMDGEPMCALAAILRAAIPLNL